MINHYDRVENYFFLSEKIKTIAKTILHEFPNIDFDIFYKKVIFDLNIKVSNQNSQNKVENIKKTINDKLITIFSETISEGKNCKDCNLLKILMHKTSLSASKKKYAITNELEKLNIFIVGAGISGLLLAKSLEYLNCHITIYEERSKADSLSRFYTIAIKDSLVLKEIIGQDGFDYILKHGGLFEKETGILRAPISVIQQGIYSVLNAKISFKYQSPIYNISEKIDENCSDKIYILASGSKTIKKLKLETYFKLIELNKYKTSVNEMMFANETNEKQVYWRRFIPGKQWMVMSKNVEMRKTLYKNLLNCVGFSTKIDDATKALLIKLQSLKENAVVSLTKVKCSTKIQQIMQSIPFYQRNYDVIPSIATNQINFMSPKKIPVILLGDATGNVHPITISGSIKYLKIIPALSEFIFFYRIIISCETLFQTKIFFELLKDYGKLFDSIAQPVVEEVFIKTISFCLYSELERS